jgi:hypothetical protein
MISMLDEGHPKLPKDLADPSQYTFSRIREHSVMIMCLLVGSIGNGPAIVLTNNIQYSFLIKFRLMVRISSRV